MKRRSIALLLSLLLVLALTACGGSSSGGSYYATESSAAPMDGAMGAPAAANGYWGGNMKTEDAAEYDMPAEYEAEQGAGGTDSRSNLPDGVKMIYRATLELETLEFEKAEQDIGTLTEQLGGYFEQQSTYNYSSGYRNAEYTVRVPAERFDAFLRQIGDLCNVRHTTRSAEDVSESYYDVDARLKTARTKLERLQALLAQAENMEDIITIESAISDTEYQIEWLSGELRHYDALIGYSTIYITLKEVYRLTEPETAPLTFGERISQAFQSGLKDFAEKMEDFAEWLAYSWLDLLVLIAVIVLVVRIIAALRRRHRKPKEPKERKKLFGRKKKAAASEENTAAPDTAEPPDGQTTGQ